MRFNLGHGARQVRERPKGYAERYALALASRRVPREKA